MNKGLSSKELEKSYADYFNASSLNKFQQNAFDQFTKIGLPHRKLESWKYTNPTAQLPGILNNKKSEKLKIKGEDLVLSKDFETFVFYQNECIFRQSKLGIEWKKEKLNKPVQEYTDPIRALTDALSSEYNELNISSKAKVKLHLVLIDSPQSNNDVAQFRVNVSKNCELELFEQHVCLEDEEERDNNFKSTLISFELAENSKVEHVLFNDLAQSSFVYESINAQVAKDSTYTNFYINLGSHKSRFDFTTNLQGSNATTNAYGLYALKHDQHGDHFGLINHLQPRTFSNQLYKGILDDEARGIFTGKIMIHRDAQEVEANQLNKNLLISKKAHIYTRPQLEVYADDVKCAHGATVGQISDEETFYLTSRGISPDRAKKILCHAFGAEVIEKISNQVVRDFLENEVFEKFEKHVFEHLLGDSNG